MAFYKDESLVTLQFTTQSQHSLKLQYIRRLRNALMDKGIPVKKVVHVGVRNEEWNQLQFDLAEGMVGNRRMRI